MKRWIIAPAIQQPKHIKTEISDALISILFNRGIQTGDEMEHFLRPDYTRDLKDPFLFLQMRTVCDLIMEAVRSQKSVMIHGDYDADGVCSSVLLYETLKQLGLKKVDIYLPHRDKEGYGLNPNTVKMFIRQKIKLMIAVDCGTTNVEEITMLNKAKIQTIVIDHHHTGTKIPPVDAILNPYMQDETYPFQKLASVGVVFKLVQALRIVRPDLITESFEKWALDLVAIATVTDCVDLISENRIFVSYGLKILRKTRRIGLQSLVAVSNIAPENIATYEIGYMIGPRINAAGRMDHANTAVALFLANDAVQAQELAQELNITNQERQHITETIVNKAKEIIATWKKIPRVIVVHQPLEDALGTWPVGLVGLVAGRLVQLYHRPVFVIGSSQEKGFMGSGRSIPTFDIIDAIARSCSDLFANFGGHSQACGFTLKSPQEVEIFATRINEYGEQNISDDDIIPALHIDAMLDFDAITPQFLDELHLLEPVGMGNPKPLFATQEVTVTALSAVGADSQHLRMTLSHHRCTFPAIGFRFGEFIHHIQPNSIIDIAYELAWNEWNGSKNIQLRIVDIKKTENGSM